MMSTEIVKEDSEKIELKRFISRIKERKGLDLTLYRPTFLLRRIKTRMYSCGLEGISAYLTKVEKDLGEWEKLLEALSINVSEFFRDGEVFDYFAKHCLRELVERKKANKQRIIRFWSAGCSFGEEPYSLAIMLRENINEDYFFAKVFATDIDTNSLAKAKKGLYHESVLKNVPSKLKERYFIRVKEDIWSVDDSLRKMITFRQHNLFEKPLFKYFDAVFCRNVRIYFSAQQSEEVLWNIYNALAKGGYLVLGKVEAVPVSLKKYFVDIESSCKIFQKKETKGR